MRYDGGGFLPCRLYEIASFFVVGNRAYHHFDIDSPVVSEVKWV